MSIVKEFKEFAMKGNVVDLAVGVIIGGAFGKIVSSMVSDIVMPVIGLLVGGVNFTNLGIALSQPADGKEGVILKYGNFLQVTFDFIIVAFAIFLAIKAMNATKKKEAAAPAAPAPTPEDVVLLREIRDALKK